MGFGHNCPIKLINGSDEMHDRELLPLSCGCWIMIGRSRWSHVNARYKTHQNSSIGSRSDASDAFFRDLISTVITLGINGGD